MSSLVLSDERSDTKKDVNKNSYASIITKASSLNISKATVEVSQKTNGKSSAPPKNENDIATEVAREVLKKDKSSKSSSTDEIMDTKKAMMKRIYLRIPKMMLKRMNLMIPLTLTSAVKKFGNVKHKNIHIRTIGDGYRYVFMEFNSQKATKQAVEAGCIQFDGYEYEVEYKKGDTQGQEGHDRSTGSSRGSVGENKSGEKIGKGNGSKSVV
ncbi:Nuclear transport factor 2 [Artemisia annua]|uniref:Nuclear transport factor 2 n=1 Tax=Artemisia annua TaxID=35608 RepID=A0A2U1QKQ7_ARTAN|nr:Nuclear transport factor 2 [Artemisia annua]